MISGAGKGAVKRSPLQEQVLETGKQLLSKRANAHVLAFKGSGNSFHWNKGSYSEGMVGYAESQGGTYFGKRNLIFQQEELFLCHILKNHI